MESILFLEHAIFEFSLLNMLTLKLKAKQVPAPAKYLLLIFKYFVYVSHVFLNSDSIRLLSLKEFIQLRQVV